MLPFLDMKRCKTIACYPNLTTTIGGFEKNNNNKTN